MNETKTCPKCHLLLPLLNFSKGQVYCRLCRKAYRLSKKEEIAAYQKEYRLLNKDRIAALNKKYYELRDKNAENLRLKQYYERNPEKQTSRHRKYYEANRETILAKGKEYASDNKAVRLSYNRNYQCRKASATPLWADLEKIAEIYKEREKLSIQTGVVHHVDHIVPLRGKNVCGLHVEYNLQVIPASKNLSKANKYGNE